MISRLHPVCTYSLSSYRLAPIPLYASSLIVDSHHLCLVRKRPIQYLGLYETDELLDRGFKDQLHDM